MMLSPPITLLMGGGVSKRGLRQQVTAWKRAPHAAREIHLQSWSRRLRTQRPSKERPRSAGASVTLNERAPVIAVEAAAEAEAEEEEEAEAEALHRRDERQCPKFVARQRAL